MLSGDLPRQRAHRFRVEDGRVCDVVQFRRDASPAVEREGGTYCPVFTHTIFRDRIPCF